MTPITELQIFRGDETVAIVPIDDKTEFVENFMTDDAVAFDFNVSSPLELLIDDFILINTEEYFLAENPKRVQTSLTNYRYTGRFESPLYSMYFELMMHLGDVEFSYTGTAREHLELLVACANSDWVIGEVDVTDIKTINYNVTYCREALPLIAKEFGLEFKAKLKTIDLIAHVGTIIDLPIAYGQGKGLYSLTRLGVDKSKIINRVLAFGGIQNIDHTYRDGLKKLVFEERYLDAPSSLRRRVGVYENPEIYPKRTGTVTAVTDLVEDTQLFTITDTSLDFDINDCLLEGLSAKVSFKTGGLTGSDFEIHKYDPVTKIITLKASKDKSDYVLPNATFKAAIGNTYVLIDIKMPISYVVNAELDLKAKAQAYLDTEKLAKVIYDLNAIDEHFILKSGVRLSVADKLPLVDDDLDIDNLLRITGLRFPLVKPWAVKAIISNFLYYTEQGKNNELVEKHEKQIKQNTKVNAELARNTASDYRKLQNRLFDPDGKLAAGALSIMAAMFKSGFDSQNFGLVNVAIDTNIGGDENKLSISAGVLVHYVYNIEGVGYQWAMSPNSWAGLNPAKFYYVYAKCSQTTLFGSWEISETPVKTNDIDGYWCFNLGQLFEVNTEGYRRFDFTKGVTWIVGNQITTGRLQDISKQNFFDLETGQFNLGGIASGIDWNISQAGKLTIRGAIAVSPSGAKDYIPVYRGDYNSWTAYYLGDEVKYTDGNYYKWFNESVGGVAGVVPTNPAYWRQTNRKGTDGKFTELRYRINGSATVPPAIDSTNPNPASWSTVMPTVGALEYLWISTTIKNADGTLVNTWATPARFLGIDGANGAAGARGAFVTPRGVYDPAAEYIGSADLVNAVKYLGSSYVSRIDAGTFTNKLPTNTAYWNAVTADFDMVAAMLVLADVAYIDNLGAERIRTAATGKRIEVNRNGENSLEFFDASTTYGRRVINIDDDAGVDGEGTFYTFFPEYDEFGNALWIYTLYVAPDTRYYYRNKDVGISIGYSPAHADGFTSIGRKRIVTTGDLVASSADTNTQARVTKDGFKITGTLGEGILSGDTGVFYDYFGNPVRVVGGIIVSGLT